MNDTIQPRPPREPDAGVVAEDGGRLSCQAVFTLIQTDPPAERVQQVTFVPFLPDGRCAVIERPGCPALPAGEVLDGEDYLTDTVLRVPLQTAGFRYQRLPSMDTWRAVLRGITESRDPGFSVNLRDRLDQLANV